MSLTLCLQSNYLIKDWLPNQICLQRENVLDGWTILYSLMFDFTGTSSSSNPSIFSFYCFGPHPTWNSWIIPKLWFASCQCSEVPSLCLFFFSTWWNHISRWILTTFLHLYPHCWFLVDNVFRYLLNWLLQTSRRPSMWPKNHTLYIPIPPNFQNPTVTFSNFLYCSRISNYLSLAFFL